MERDDTILNDIFQQEKILPLITCGASRFKICVAHNCVCDVYDVDTLIAAAADARITTHTAV